MHDSSYKLHNDRDFRPFSYDKLSDEELVELAIDKDDDAFGALMRRYVRMIVALACSKTSSVTEAEDIAQDTFVDAFRKLDSIRDSSKFRSWLTMIAVNNINAFHRNAWRKRRGFRKVTLNENEFSELSDMRPDPRAMTESGLTTSHVIETIANLESKIGDVVYMKLIEELSCREIAKRLKINQSTARMRLMRGLEKLRHQLESKGYR